MPATKDQLTKSPAYPAGEYELEICEVSFISGTNAKGEPWEQAKLVTEIVSPENLAGKKFTTRFFLDKRLGDLITVGLGKNLDEVFGKNDTLENNRISALLTGSFFRCRLGVKNGYNEVAEILPPEKPDKPEMTV